MLGGRPRRAGTALARRGSSVRTGMALVLGGVALGWALRRWSDVHPARPGRLPMMGLADTLAFIAEVPLPNVAKGVIKRRKWMVGLSEKLDLDRRAIRRMQSLHKRYGPGPVLLRIPFRRQAVIFEPEHLRRVLAETPEPFSPASGEKVAALSHFQPHGVLISTGADRADRRRFNEEVLESDNPVHRMAESFERVAAEEAGEMLDLADKVGGFGWDEFAQAWFRVVRRVALGDGARDDRNLHRLLTALREDGNWAFAKPRRHDKRQEFLARLKRHLDRAEQGSLAAAMARTPRTERTKAEEQPPQWLFAFDPAGMATYRALALLAAHPDQAGAALAEADRAVLHGEQARPHLRAALLEALRLWPTTPLILRQSTADTDWDGRLMPSGTGVMIFTNFFHRDGRRLAQADQFAPEFWLRDSPAGDPPLVPFSEGGAICPGRHLVLLIGSRFLAEILNRADVTLGEPARLTAGDLPASFDHYTLRLRTSPRANAGRKAQEGSADELIAPEALAQALRP